MARLTRRSLLRGSALLPLATLPLLQGCGRADSVTCADPELMSRGEEQMRKTLAYVEQSADPAQLCSGCQFFGAADATGCGHCEILDGQVAAAGFCTSWAARS